MYHSGFSFDVSLVDASGLEKRLPDETVTSAPAHGDYVIDEKEEKCHLDFDQQSGIFAVDVANLAKMNYLLLPIARTCFMVH